MAKKNTRVRKRRGRAPLKRLTLGGSYPIRQGRGGGGGGTPYFITRDPTPQQDIQLQLPPTMLQAFQEYMVAGREAARTAQEGAKAIEAGAKATSSVLDVGRKAAPYAVAGGAAALVGAYIIAPETTTNLVTTAGTNLATGAAKTAGKVAVNVATKAVKGTANVLIKTGQGAANAAVTTTKSIAQIPANHMPSASTVINLTTGWTLAAWLAYVAGMATGNAPAALIPP